jgi:uncharacterized membrane protein YfcA
MGAINNVAGGAGILGLWAFEYACGLPLRHRQPVVAAGAVGVGLFALLGYLRAGLRPAPGTLAAGPVCHPRRLARQPAGPARPTWCSASTSPSCWHCCCCSRRAAAHQPTALALAGPLGCVLIGLHMGFAQVGTGFVATLVLVSTLDRDLLRANVAKSVVVITSSIASLIGFLLAPWLLANQPPVIAWGPALCLAAGTATGSYLASQWTVAKGSAVVRRVVVVIAALSLLEQLVQILRLPSWACPNDARSGRDRPHPSPLPPTR